MAEKYYGLKARYAKPVIQQTVEGEVINLGTSQTTAITTRASNQKIGGKSQRVVYGATRAQVHELFDKRGGVKSIKVSENKEDLEKNPNIVLVYPDEAPEYEDEEAVEELEDTSKKKSDKKTTGRSSASSTGGSGGATDANT